MSTSRPLLSILITTLLVVTCLGATDNTGGRLLEDYAKALAAAAEDYAREESRLAQKRAAAEDRARQGTVRELDRIARRSDPAAAAGIYRTILQITSEHAAARSFFQALGTLDEVLAEISQEADLLGNVIVEPSLLAPVAPLGRPLRVTIIATANEGFTLTINNKEVLRSDDGTPQVLTHDVRRGDLVVMKARDIDDGQAAGAWLVFQAPDGTLMLPDANWHLYKEDPATLGFKGGIPCFPSTNMDYQKPGDAWRTLPGTQKVVPYWWHPDRPKQCWLVGRL